jgi:hypothetical protein
VTAVTSSWTQIDAIAKISSMQIIRAKFDGEKISLPSELRGAAPDDILIVYPASQAQEHTSHSRGLSSIWDVFGKAQHPRSTEDINQQIKEERESWGDR